DRVPVDPSADVMGLGRIAAHALTGEPHPAAASVAPRCPGAPAELTALIDRMLAGTSTASEVRACAGWLAATVELMPAKTRWTPAHGIGDKVPVTDATDGGFQIRISRTPTRG